MNSLIGYFLNLVVKYTKLICFKLACNRLFVFRKRIKKRSSLRRPYKEKYAKGLVKKGTRAEVIPSVGLADLKKGLIC